MPNRRFSRNDRLLIASVLAILLLIATGFAQSKGNKPKFRDQSTQPTANAVMWEPVTEPRDLFWGPGGQEMAPDLSRVTFVKKETGGHNTKYRIKDGSGRTWIAKLGREARHLFASDELDQVEGVGTDVTEGAGEPGARGIDAPFGLLAGGILGLG